MARKLIGVIMIAVLTLGVMAGCGESKKDFDGSNYTNTGKGELYIVTSDGTSEGGNVPKLITGENPLLVSIGYETSGMEYTQCVVYIDGMKNGEVVVSDMSCGTICLTGDELSEGVHTVEVVATKDEKVTIYKFGQYEVV